MPPKGADSSLEALMMQPKMKTMVRSSSTGAMGELKNTRRSKKSDFDMLSASTHSTGRRKASLAAKKDLYGLSSSTHSAKRRSSLSGPTSSSSSRANRRTSLAAKLKSISGGDSNGYESDSSKKSSRSSKSTKSSKSVHKLRSRSASPKRVKAADEGARRKGSKKDKSDDSSVSSSSRRAVRRNSDVDGRPRKSNNDDLDLSVKSCHVHRRAVAGTKQTLTRKGSVRKLKSEPSSPDSVKSPNPKKGMRKVSSCDSVSSASSKKKMNRIASNDSISSMASKKKLPKLSSSSADSLKSPSGKKKPSSKLSISSSSSSDDKYKKKYEKLKEDFQKAQMENLKLKDDLRINKREIVRLKEKTDKMDDRYNSLQKQHDELRETHRTRVNKHDVIIEAKDKEIRELGEQVDKILEMERAKKTGEPRIDDLAESLATDRVKVLDARIRLMEDEKHQRQIEQRCKEEEIRREAKAEVKEWKDKAKSKDDTIAHLMQQLQDLKLQGNKIDGSTATTRSSGWKAPDYSQAPSSPGRLRNFLGGLDSSIHGNATRRGSSEAAQPTSPGRLAAFLNRGTTAPAQPAGAGSAASSLWRPL